MFYYILIFILFFPSIALFSNLYRSESERFSNIIFCPPSPLSCFHHLSHHVGPSIPRAALLKKKLSNWPIKWKSERALAKQEVTSPGSEVMKDNGCGVGGNFLPLGRGACVVCVCVYILSGVSIYSHGDPGENGKSPNTATDCQMVSSISYESATETLGLFTK